MVVCLPGLSMTARCAALANTVKVLLQLKIKESGAQWRSTSPFHPVYQVVWLHFPCQWFNRDFVDFVVFGGGKVCRGCHGDCFVLTQQGGDGIAGLRLVIKV